MPTKSLRILIADAEPDQVLKIELALNALGYYRIAPLYSQEALSGLSDAAAHDFDLLLVNRIIAGGPVVGEAQFRKDNPQFRHVLMYVSANSLVPQLVELMKAVDP